MPYDMAIEWLGDINKNPPLGQIAAEIDFFKQRYKNLVPAMAIHYIREAYTGGNNFRLTLDYNVTASKANPSLMNDCPECKIINDDQYLIEIKSMGSIPMWLVSTLSECCAYKQPFSKYGSAYKQLIMTKSTGY